ncbi:MAG: hypothetical protein QXE79_02120 [Candidatus Bathyarchaeia archaeon]
MVRMNKIHENPKLFKLLEEKGILITKNNLKIIKGMYKDSFNYISHGIVTHAINPDMDRNTAKRTVDFILGGSSSVNINIEFRGKNRRTHNQVHHQIF